MATTPPSPNPATASDTATAGSSGITRRPAHTPAAAPTRPSTSTTISQRPLLPLLVRPLTTIRAYGSRRAVWHIAASLRVRSCQHGGVDDQTRVCPYCARPPGPGVFCEACGRNLADVERLPTAREFAAAHPSSPPTSPPTAASVAKTVREFLETMGAAGNPGTVQLPCAKPRAFRRTPQITGWIVIPVDREDLEKPHRYEPGLLLSVDGTFHRLDSELRGWGQRDFPQYAQRVSPEPLDLPADQAQHVLTALAALHSAN